MLLYRDVNVLLSVMHEFFPKMLENNICSKRQQKFQVIPRHDKCERDLTMPQCYITSELPMYCVHNLTKCSIFILFAASPCHRYACVRCQCVVHLKYGRIMKLSLKIPTTCTKQCIAVQSNNQPTLRLLRAYACVYVYQCLIQFVV